VTPAAIRRHCLALPAATANVQWGNDLVFKIGGKMFAAMDAGPGADAISFKCDEDGFRLLTELPGIAPARYLARAFWVTVSPLDALPAAHLAAYLARAHALVAARLPRATRRALGLDVAPTTRTASATRSARRASRARSGTSARSGTRRRPARP
jgi:predicted DNA-binding protein (MmcQ/YjbR family)